MAYVDWRMRGAEITSCNCDWGCPCQFNALPTHGDCRAVVAMRIDEGHFGDVPLSGLKWAATFAWPEAIHLGHGEAFIVIDDSADEAQRAALLTILSALETVHEPAFLPIDFAVDMEGRTGRIAVDGMIDSRIEPIRNPVTGGEHRVRVSLPGGFEYREAEYASGETRASGPIALTFGPSHAHVANVDFSTSGVA